MVSTENIAAPTVAGIETSRLRFGKFNQKGWVREVLMFTRRV